MSASSDPRALAQLRQELDRLDAQLVDLLAERQRLVDEVARAKQQLGVPMYDAARETQLVARAQQLAAQSGLDAEYVARVLRVVLDESLRRHPR